MKSILIVDDRVINLEFLATLLGYANYQVLKAANGAQALDMARLERPDLVISDILMPVMDGIELVRQLHADPATDQIPVIFYTATYSMSEAAMMAHTLGVAAVLTKPSEPGKILETVLKTLGDVLTLPPETAPIISQPNAVLPVPPLLADLQHRLQEALIATTHVDATTDMPGHPMHALANVQTLSLRLAALLELSITLSAERDSQRLLERFCRAAQNIMNATHTAVGMQGIGQPRRVATCGMTSEEVQVIFEAIEPGAALLHDAFISGSSIDIRDAAINPAWQQLPDNHPLRRRFLMVPILLGGHPHGWFYLAGKLDAPDFTLEDKEVATTLAAQLAPHYENLNLYEEVRQYVDQLENEVLERKLVAEKLQQSEAGLRRAQILTKSAHIVSRADGVFESWSKTLPQLIGVTDAQVPPTLDAWLDLVDPEDRANYLACTMAAVERNARTEVGYRVRRSDGATITLQHVLEPLRELPDADGKLRWFHTIQDVTKQKDQERKVARLSRMSAVLSSINSAIVRFHDRNALFQETCRIAVNQGAFGMAWIGLANAKNDQITEWLGHQSDIAHQLTGAPGHDAPWSVALREQRPVFFNNIDIEPSLRPQATMLRTYDVESVGVLPLMLGSQVVAVVVLFAHEVDFFDDEEIKLLNELAGDLSFGLQFIDKEERISYLACYDVLTGLPNGMLFQDRLGQLLRGPKIEKSLTCVVVLDLDHFSQLNDVLGRQAGDMVLRQVAERLRARLTPTYSLAHISGDIFAIAVPDLQQAEDVEVILEQQIFGVFNTAFAVNEQEIRITMRAGLALYPDDGRDAETLFKHAEVALKKAKSSDERYLYYAPQMNAAIAARLALKGELQLALDRRQFVVYYQPRVSLVSGRIVSAEALIRWRHPQRGMVPPDQFIPLTEETGLIVPIGAWVIDTVCEQQVAWLAHDVPAVPVAVNLSAVQIKKGLVLPTIRAAIERHQLDTRYIEFELTESMVMNDPEEAADNLHALKHLGVKLSLDDFGTGYSSLAYLKQFPFDYLKIDRAFITDITNSPKDAMIATAVIAMGHSLNLRVVAEGVETQGQLDYLRSHHCDEMQGFYFSQPVPAAVFERMLREDKRLLLPPLA